MTKQFIGLLVLFLFLCPEVSLMAQSRGHTLYGDLQIDEKSLAGLPPSSFLVSLVTISGGGSYAPGNVIDRNQVPPNGRYKFMDVPNGEFELVVELNGVDVGRMRMIIQERRFTELRRDIALQWKPDLASRAGAAPAPAAYSRSGASRGIYEKGQDAMRKNDLPQAVASFEQVTQADPKDFEAWTDLGTAHFKREKWGDSEKAYQKALEARPGYFPAMLNLGKLRLAQKKPEGAVDILSQAVQSEPGSADAQYFLGEAFLQIKKGSKAVGCLNEALRLDPVGKADAHLRLGALYNAAGMKDKAAAEYEQFLVKKPDYPDRKKIEQYIKDNRK